MADQAPITSKDNEIPASASRVTLDGRTDPDKIIELRKMKKEDSRLDYKAFMQPDKAAHGLLKDIVAMANAEGGYIVVGIDEAKDYRFCGLPDPELEKKLTSGNLQQTLTEYTKAVVNVSASWVDVEEEETKARCFVIFVTAATVPAIFEKAYQVGTNFVFRQGEYWIRKGSSNSWATSTDMHDLLMRVRSQERQQLSGLRRFDEQIAGLLQRIANSLDGKAGRLDAGIVELPAEQIKIESSRLFENAKPTELAKALRRFRRTLKAELGQVRSLTPETMDEAAMAWADRFIPVYYCLWVSAVDEGAPELQKEIVTALGDVLEDTWDAGAGNQEKKGVRLQRPIAYLVVAMAALAIERNNPGAAGLAIDVRAGRKDSFWGPYSLLRYAQVISSRIEEMKGFSFAAMAKDYFADKKYATEEFGDAEGMLGAFLSAELLQCLRMVVQNGPALEALKLAWPGYVVYHGDRMEPMILSILKNPKEWLGIEKREDVARAFWEVETFARRVANASHYSGSGLELYVPEIKELFRVLRESAEGESHR